jgi:hypothetical protein
MPADHPPELVALDDPPARPRRNLARPAWHRSLCQHSRHNNHVLRYFNTFIATLAITIEHLANPEWTHPIMKGFSAKAESDDI